MKREAMLASSVAACFCIRRLQAQQRGRQAARVNSYVHTAAGGIRYTVTAPRPYTEKEAMAPAPFRAGRASWSVSAGAGFCGSRHLPAHMKASGSCGAAPAAPASPPSSSSTSASTSCRASSSTDTRLACTRERTQRGAASADAAVARRRAASSGSSTAAAAALHATKASQCSTADTEAGDGPARAAGQASEALIRVAAAMAGPVHLAAQA